MWNKLRERRTVIWAGAIVGVLVVFSLGVATGEGRLRLVGPQDFAGRTGLPANLNYAELNQVYDTMREKYNGPLTQSQVMDGLKHGLADSAGDPYTQYFTAKEAKVFEGKLQGISLTGIGAQLDQDAAGDIIVMSPVPGSPAAAAGLLAKDIIVTINNESTAGMSVNTAVTKIRGAKGTKVTIGVQRGDTPLKFTITRDTISLPTATGKVLDGNIGYLQVSQFSDDTYELTQKAVTDLKAKGVTKIILDLRDNPGGEVTAAQDISSLWMDDNTVVMEERRGDTVVHDYRSTGVNPLKGVPTVVLVNGGSASASEITALALRDTKSATIIGEKSYGKGVVQAVVPFSDGSELKVTVAKWYSPKGISINKKGITPDQTVSQSATDTAAGVDTQLQAAQNYLQSK